MNATGKTLRNLSDLTDAKFVHTDKRTALEDVAARYAIAITPAMAELIDHSNPNKLLERSFWLVLMSKPAPTCIVWKPPVSLVAELLI